MSSQPAALAIGKKPAAIRHIAYLFTLGFTGISMLYLLATHTPDASGGVSPQVALALMECVLGLAAVHLPAVVTRMFRITLPDALCVAFYAFIICAIPLGEVFAFYYRIPFWDTLLHFSSGMMLCICGGLMTVYYLRKKQCDSLISPVCIGVVSVLLALSAGVLWEFYEFAVDALAGMNMQKCLLEDGTALVGQAALQDTMKDLIVDVLGAVTAACVCMPSLKRHIEQSSHD